MTINSAPGLPIIRHQSRLFGLLSTLLQNQALPHAVLFSGVAGIGKEALALQLAMMCNCLHADRSLDAREKTVESKGFDDMPPPRACGKCNTCRKMLLGNHPDLTWVKPQGAFIRIEQIRELIRIFSLKSYEAKTRVAIIPQAHRLNPAAGNAILKILEEPPNHSLLILTSDQPGEILPTIRSRCQQMALQPVTTEEISLEIQDRWKIGEAPARAVAKMSNGSPARANDMIEKGWLQKRDWLFSRLSNLAQLSTRETLLIAKTIASQGNPVDEDLEIFRSWYRDVAIIEVHSGALIHDDWGQQIRHAAAAMDATGVDASIETIYRAQKAIGDRANSRLRLEAMMLELHARAKNRCRKTDISTAA